MTPVFGAMYDEPGDVVACEDHAANPFVLPGASLQRGGCAPCWQARPLAPTGAGARQRCGAITMLRRG